MAQLEVRPKKNTPWWVWLLILAAIIAIIMFLTRRGSDMDMDNKDWVDTISNVEPDLGVLSR